MVKGDVQVALTVHSDADDVVGIAAVALVLGALHSPVVGPEGAFAQGEVSLGIVVGDILRAGMGGDGIVAEHGGVHRIAAPTKAYGAKPLCLCHEARTAEGQYAQAYTFHYTFHSCHVLTWAKVQKKV